MVIMIINITVLFAGILLAAKTGDRVCSGDVIAWLHTNREESLPAVTAEYLAALEIGDTPPLPRAEIYGAVDETGLFHAAE